METFLIDVPMPSMGATVNELTVVSLRITAGHRVAKGQKLAELESDKSIFEFESPCEGTIRSIRVKAGDVRPAGAPFLQIETSDASLRHLQAQTTEDRGQTTAKAPNEGGSSPSSAVRPLVWTPRATKLALDAGLDPAALTGIAATGPGGRVSGDDVANFLATRKAAGGG